MASGSQTASTFLSTDPESRLALDNADPANWIWHDHERQQWEKLETGAWHEFADKWRYSKELDLEDLSGSFLNDIALPASQDHSFIVRECYVEAEKLIWKRAWSMPETGAIITGQPGIGKTLFLWYLLLRLLQKKQVVLLHANYEDFLFYHDGVYGTFRHTRARHLPSPRSGLIWSLFDLFPRERFPELAIDPQCFPVQCPSPNRDLYPWRKQRGPLYTVFPLWTIEELEFAVQRSPKFNAFKTGLQNVIQVENWKNPNFLPTVSNPSLIQHLAVIFPKVRPKSFEDAFSTLLDDLVSSFGAIPREVFRAMFRDFKEVEDDHSSALDLSFDDLQKAADDLSRPDPSADVRGLSHRLISPHNVGTLESKKLEIDFLSPVIAEKFSKQLLEESHVRAGSTIKHFLALPQTRGLAGTLFEPFAHRLLANTDQTNGTWALKLMSSRDNSNTFVLHGSESSETVAGFPKIKRRLVSFHSKDLPPLYENAYYIPGIINHPLFDSFVVSFPPLPQPQRLWLLQMTTSKLHRGSQMGYAVVQEIIDQITQQRPTLPAKADKKGKRKAEEPLSVEVNYVLVRPTGEEEHKWVLPEGWEEASVYLLELPLEHDIDLPNTRAMQSQKKTKLSTSGKKTPSTSGQRRSARLNRQ